MSDIEFQIQSDFNQLLELYKTLHNETAVTLVESLLKEISSFAWELYGTVLEETADDDEDHLSDTDSDTSVDFEEELKSVLTIVNKLLEKLSNFNSQYATHMHRRLVLTREHILDKLMDSSDESSLEDVSKSEYDSSDDEETTKGKFVVLPNLVHIPNAF